MAFRRWFPLSFQAQTLFFANFTRAFIQYAPSLGFTAEDIAKLKADNDAMQYLAQTETSIKTFKKSFQALRHNLAKGNSVANLAYTHYAPLAEPPMVACGIFNRLFRLADRIAAADGYTPSIGAQFNILPKSKEALRPEDLALKLRSVSALNEAQAEIRFVRGKTSGVNLYFQRAGGEDWFDLGRFFYSPVVVKIPLLEAGKPEEILLRGRYLIGNETVGNYSAITTLILKP